MVVCSKCGKLTDLITVDVGNYEEFWGAPVWRSELVDVTACCGSDEYEDEYAEGDE
jgi:hypothetical protein